MSVRVLVADDQEPFRRAARSVLAATAGFELVGEAESGEDAVALVGALDPDLALLDVAMAGIGGIEATRRITESHPRTVTILISTYRLQDLPATARHCGATAYLHKSEFGGPALRALWDGEARGAPPGTGSRPSRACAPTSPRQDRA